MPVDSGHVGGMKGCSNPLGRLRALSFLSEVEGWTNKGLGVDAESRLAFLSSLAIELVVGTEDDLR